MLFRSRLELRDSQVEKPGPADVGRDELARRLDSGEKESQVSGGDSRLRRGVLRLEDVLDGQGAVSGAAGVVCGDQRGGERTLVRVTISVEGGAAMVEC